MFDNFKWNQLFGEESVLNVFIVYTGHRILKYLQTWIGTVTMKYQTAK